MKITNEIYEFTPRYAIIELAGFCPEEVEKLRDKQVTIVLKNVCLEGSRFYHITPNYVDTKLEFFGG